MVDDAVDVFATTRRKEYKDLRTRLDMLLTSLCKVLRRVFAMTRVRTRECFAVLSGPWRSKRPITATLPMPTPVPITRSRLVCACCGLCRR